MPGRSKKKDRGRCEKRGAQFCQGKRESALFRKKEKAIETTTKKTTNKWRQQEHISRTGGPPCYGGDDGAEKIERRVQRKTRETVKGKQLCFSRQNSGGGRQASK